MKKTLVALAVLGSFSIPAFAQSSVTLYGLIDVGYGITNGGDAEGNPGRDGKFQQLGSARWTSRWGMKGSEDLGNGMKVLFNLEAAFDPETGSDKGGFNRKAYVGLSGGFGTVLAGRQSALIDDTISTFSITGDPNTTAPTYNTGIGSGQRYSNYDSALTYLSPEFGGFSFGVQYIAKNDLASAGNQGAGGDKNLFALALNYNYNKFSIGASVETKPYSGASAAWGIGASYDFGSFLISGGYFDSHFKEDGKGFHLGVMVPVNAWEFGAQIAYNTKAYAGTETKYGAYYIGGWGGNIYDPNNYVTYSWDEDKKVKPLAWTLFANYNLSKRTTFYAMYGGIDSDAKEFLGASRKYSVAAGIHHSF